MVKSKAIKTEKVRPFNYKPAIDATFSEYGLQDLDPSKVNLLKKGAFDVRHHFVIYVEPFQKHDHKRKYEL